MSPHHRNPALVAAAIFLFAAVAGFTASASSSAAADRVPSASAGHSTTVRNPSAAAHPPGVHPHAFAEPDPAVFDELSSGRYWHASLLFEDGDGASPLLRARSEAGWKNWPAAWALLESVEELPPDERAAAWALRGRAAEETERWDQAVTSYRRALEDSTGLEPDSALVVRLRLARSLAGSATERAAIPVLERAATEAPWAASWLGVEMARAWADRGEVEAARRALATVTDPGAVLAGWEVMARAHLVSGDTAAALDAYLAEARRLEDGTERAAAWTRIGRLRLAREEPDPSRRAFRNALAAAANTEAARSLVVLGLDDPEEALRVHSILRRAGDEVASLEALERHAELRESSEPLPDALRLIRAELLFRTDRLAEASAELEWLTARDEMEVAAPALDLLADVRRRQGLAGEARAFRDLLVQRFPSHPDAVDVVFFRADDLHDRGSWSAALAAYGRTAEMAPGADRAGLARMRMGQIHLMQGSYRDAAGVYESYLEAFPRGRRWEESRYWAARSRLALGEDDAAREHVEAIVEGTPLSYYAILGRQLVDERFSPDIPEGSAPPQVPAIEEALDRVRVLEAAGLGEGVPHAIRALSERYAAAGDSLLRLSLELSERGFSLRGITLGWEVQSRGRPWDLWLVRAIYPFPYRELVRLEAEEWGLDPFHLAALIRQESAFLAEARSGAGAMGLMQVIPSTGQSLAQSYGPERFQEDLLLHPEVNLHLGAAFLSRLQGRFDERTPLVLAAYNAGPTRASRWERDFPEIQDLERFTERIPYVETRGYVKNVTRNTELYRWLYGRGE